MPDGPHVALLDASLGDTHVQRNFTRELDARLSIVRVSEGEPLAPWPDAGAPRADWPYDALIVSGSQSSVYDDRPWIASVERYVQRVLASQAPVLGVCWGHQLLAQALGGTVRNQERYELGYVSVEQVAEDPIWDDVPHPFTVFATHSDAVTRLPQDATLLAENEAGVQAFRHGSAVGVQFHPEYDRRCAQDMIRRKSLPDAEKQAARDTITDANVQAARAPKQLLHNFLRMAKAHRTALHNA
jgi:GMP synthase (glutamine-hydrolysing)